MPEQEVVKVYSYTTLDDKVFIYRFTNEHEMQGIVESFPDEVFFELSDEEEAEYFTTEPDHQDNLKQDFIWFRPGVSKRSIMECTCGKFLESANPTEVGHEWLAKQAVKHARKTGHQLNPRGN